MLTAHPLAFLIWTLPLKLSSRSNYDSARKLTVEWRKYNSMSTFLPSANASYLHHFRYLDASTRDQYANGDLDARVEDVLGQIRELSIAGTV